MWLQERDVLFGKYQICRTIGQGRSGTVFLARHLSLDEPRAVKRVRKDAYAGDYSGEAFILKSLRHPGIPIIYDLEEDGIYYYLIEEYLEGESLFSLLKRQGNLTRAKVISYGIELCQIMNYLHSLQQYPILYLDLQPKNLIVCDGALKLIDFDQAVSADFAGRIKKRFGTCGFAAPEQFTDQPLDQRTDIYAIGALLYYMGTGVFPAGEEAVSDEMFGEKLAAVIRQCLRPSKDERFGDARSLLTELLGLRTGGLNHHEISLLKFAVVGSSHGMGSTHVSLGLASYLSGRGISSLYVEENGSGDVRGMAASFKTKPDGYGIYHIKSWDLKPKYGECVKLDLPDYGALILDYGADVEAVECGSGFSAVLLICGGKWWEEDDTARAADLLSQKKDVRLLFNHLIPGVKPAVGQSVLSIPCFELPYFPDPEGIGQQLADFFEEILTGTGADSPLYGGKTAPPGRRKGVPMPWKGWLWRRRREKTEEKKKRRR